MNHIEQAIEKQFEDKGNRKFRLRASNIGRATCQLWFMKNKPEKAVARGTNFLLRMLIGDITEAVFKGVLTEAGVNYGEPEKVQVDIAGETISGEYDLIVDNKVDDIKSASPWSYRNKWTGGDNIEKKNRFERCYEPIEETYRGKPSGRYVLNTECQFCDFRYACWGKALSKEPSKVSKAKEKPMVYYVEKGEVTQNL